MKPQVSILHAIGTNRDRETAWAVEQAGGEPHIVHVNELRERPARLHEFQMLILPAYSPAAMRPAQAALGDRPALALP